MKRHPKSEMKLKEERNDTTIHAPRNKLPLKYSIISVLSTI